MLAFHDCVIAEALGEPLTSAVALAFLRQCAGEPFAIVTCDDPAVLRFLGVKAHGLGSKRTIRMVLGSTPFGAALVTGATVEWATKALYHNGAPVLIVEPGTTRYLLVQDCLFEVVADRFEPFLILRAFERCFDAPVRFRVPAYSWMTAMIRRALRPERLTEEDKRAVRAKVARLQEQEWPLPTMRIGSYGISVP